MGMRQVLIEAGVAPDDAIVFLQATKLASGSGGISDASARESSPPLLLSDFRSALSPGGLSQTALDNARMNSAGVRSSRPSTSGVWDDGVVDPRINMNKMPHGISNRDARTIMSSQVEGTRRPSPQSR